MRIKKIVSIKQYGIFSDYSNSETKDFSNNNIIFGWNYSGKTMLSRIFRSLEKKEPHPDFTEAKFKLIDDADNEITESDVPNNSFKMRVFNSDYIRENLQWERPTEGIPPILIIGEENIKQQQNINQLKIEKDELSKQQSEIIRKKNEKQIAFNTLLTNEATRISNELSIVRNFRRPDLDDLINNTDIINWLLSDSDFLKKKTIALSRHKLGLIQEITIMPEGDILDKTKALILKTAIPSKTIERLKKDTQIENWVREGLSLHRDKKKCEFCYNQLSEKLLTDLDAHFSRDYEDFRKEVEAFAAALEQKKLTDDLKNKNDFYPELQEEYFSKRSELEIEINNYNKTIDLLIRIVKEKVSKLSDEMELGTNLFLNIESLKIKTDALNKIIRSHNQKTDDFEHSIENAKESLKKHYASQFYTNYAIAEKTAEIIALENHAQMLTANIQEKTTEIQDIESMISEPVKGSEALNKFIKLYFGQNTPIEIKVLNNRFHVYRGETEAKNLSEGEKTAISFSYFLAKLLDKDTNKLLEETIVYIDDPVSSLDSNHLYNTYALLTSRLKGKCSQLFISTHNYELFNLLKDEFKEKYHKKLKCDFEGRNNHGCQNNLFQIERSRTNARLNNLDCLLCHFKSEYQFLFYQLYHSKDNIDKGDDYKLYTMPNLLRRFLEIYLSFSYPAAGGLKDSLDRLIEKEEERKLVHKIADELSHSENIERALRICTTEEIRNAINIVLIALEKKKPEYLTELMKSVGIKDDLKKNDNNNE